MEQELDRHFYHRMEKLKEHLACGRDADLRNWRSDEGHERHAHKLESWRDGVKRFAQLEQDGVLTCVQSVQDETTLRERLSQMRRDEVVED